MHIHILRIPCIAYWIYLRVKFCYDVPGLATSITLLQRSHGCKTHKHELHLDYQSQMSFQLFLQNTSQRPSHGTQPSCSPQLLLPLIVAHPLFSLVFPVQMFHLLHFFPRPRTTTVHSSQCILPSSVLRQILLLFLTTAPSHFANRASTHVSFHTKAYYPAENTN